MKFSLDSHKLIHHLDRVLEFKNRLDCVPIYMEVSPVGSCNHRCIFCAYDYIAYPNRRLNLDKFKSFASEIAKAGLKSMLFAGEGEPLMHPQIALMIKHASSLGLDLGMFSNAALLKQDLAKEILAHMTFIRFSFNAGNASVYDKIHTSHKSSSDFEKVIKNIKFAATFRQANALKLDLGSQFVLLPENISSLFDAIKNMRDCGVDYISVKPFVLQNKAQFYKNDARFSKEKLDELILKAKEYESQSFKVFFRQNAFENYGKRGYKHCYGCSFITTLNSAGELATCLPFWHKKEFVYGNINEQSFSQIWSSKKRERIRHFLQNELNAHACPPNCRPNAINEFLNEIINPDVKHINFI